MMTGQLRRQRHRLSHVITPETSRHQSQQTWHESDALRCHGNSLLGRPGRVVLVVSDLVLETCIKYFHGIHFLSALCYVLTGSREVRLQAASVPPAAQTYRSGLEVLTDTVDFKGKPSHSAMF